MIRRLGPDDGHLLKELRLAALEESPAAFLTSYEDAAGRSMDEWRDLLRPDRNPAFVWEDAFGAHGMVVAARDESGTDAVYLVALWVRPEFRGRGVAAQLVRRVLRWAAEHSAPCVRLCVTEGNDRAERLYAPGCRAPAPGRGRTSRVGGRRQSDRRSRQSGYVEVTGRSREVGAMDVDAFREQSLRTWESMAAGWEARHSFLERNMGLLSDWIIERTSPASGQAILEVGAGPGDLGHRMAALVGPGGRVISTDFASEMVEVARRLGAARGLANVEHRRLDADAMDLDDGSVDAVVGRSVYMLLADPAAALREARRVLRPGGSVAFTVFTTPEENPWAAVPAAVLVRRGHLAPPQPGAPGVFALGDPERVRALVVGAGFSAPTIEHVDFAFHYGDDEDAWNAIVDLNGPLAVIIGQLSTDEREATRRAVLDGFGPFRDPDGSYPVPAQALAVHAR